MFKKYKFQWQYHFAKTTKDINQLLIDTYGETTAVNIWLQYAKQNYKYYLNDYHQVYNTDRKVVNPEIVKYEIKSYLPKI